MYKTKSGRDITFVGQGNTDIKPVGLHYSGIKNLDDLFQILLSAGWNTDTISKSRLDTYDPDNNPTEGQCSITAALVQDIFGGQLAQVEFANGGKHSINFIDGQYIDLTSDQFTVQGKDSLDGKINIVEIGAILRDMNLVMRRNLLNLKLAQATAIKLQSANPDKLKRDTLPIYSGDTTTIKSYITELKQALQATPALSDNQLFHLIGDRAKLVEEIKSASSPDFALTKLMRIVEAKTIMTSAALVGQKQPKQIMIDDSIYKRSKLICEAEQTLLLQLIDSISQLLQ